MKFYSGFSLKNEQIFFDDYINQSEYCVCGFSYGAIKAFYYVKEQLELGNRVDTLQLISPAFFQTKSDKFKRLQMLSYATNKDIYFNKLISGCFYPYEEKTVEHVETTTTQLEELLNYEWNIIELNKLALQGVKIEVYLGSEDKIIDVEHARKFFLNVSTVTYIKHANHFLQIN